MADRWRPQRRSIRLAGYDYAGDGAYFVTICAYQRACLFGTVVDGEMRLSAAGVAVEREWLRTAELRPNILLDAFVVMPNHFHAVLFIERPDSKVDKSTRARRAVPLQHGSIENGTPQKAMDSKTHGQHNGVQTGERSVGARRAVPGYSGTRWDQKPQSNDAQDERSRSFGVPVAGDLATIIRSFKAAATRAVNALQGTEGPGIWQRNYYEVIIRNEKMLNGIRQYILTNPARWAQDDLYER